MAQDESDSGTSAGSTDGGAQATGGSTTGDGGTTSSSSEGSTDGTTTSSSSSEKFAAGRAARNGSMSGDDPLDGPGGGSSAGAGGPSEAPTVEHAQGGRTEVMGAAGGQAETPTTVQPTPPPQAQARPARSGPSAVGVALSRVLNVIARLVTIIGVLAAVVLVVFIVLRLVAVNPQNAVAQAVGAVADRLVGAFRDLFLIPDPVGTVINYGLAAIAWIVVAVIVARILRAVGRAIP